MAVTKPYRRTFRQHVDGGYSAGGNWMYVMHPKFAIAPEQYVRAFKVLQKDLLELFDFIEPADVNLPCYSYRTHELHMRTCIEIEANCKAILSENGYVRAGASDWNMGDYKKLNLTHFLSEYEVRSSVWHGSLNVRRPFASWGGGELLPWYQAYNQAKHDRFNKFALANFEALIDVFCALVALLSAQFGTYEFEPAMYSTAHGHPTDGFEIAIGGHFHVKFPSNLPATDRYDFNWQDLDKRQADPFQTLTF